MGRLEDARIKQREYAKKEYLSGDEAKGDEHSAKAEAFLVRILAGEDAEPPAEEPTEEPTEEPAEPLSSDPSTALGQILAATGHPNTGASIDPLDVLADASAEQQRELALLGFFGQPESRDDVDYSLFEQYYYATGDGNWAPNDPDTSAWATYLAGKETA